jgi:hypothetical protein
MLEAVLWVIASIAAEYAARGRLDHHLARVIHRHLSSVYQFREHPWLDEDGRGAASLARGPAPGIGAREMRLA